MIVVILSIALRQMSPGVDFSGFFFGLFGCEFAGEIFVPDVAESFSSFGFLGGLPRFLAVCSVWLGTGVGVELIGGGFGFACSVV